MRGAHTPGPWRNATVETNCMFAVNSAGEHVAMVNMSLGRDVGMATADLIAAAPELLALLKRLRDHGYTTSADHDMVCEAIAKAEGGTP